MVVLFQRNLVDDSTVAYRHLAILITNVTHDKGATGRSFEREVTIQIGHDTTFGILHLDRGTDKRLALLIDNLSLDLDRLTLSDRSSYG